MTALAVLILLPLLLVATVLLALRSETGTAWVIDRIPGLQVEEGRGSLLGQWQAESLQWQGYGVGLRVTAPEVDWSPSCLFGMEVCLEILLAERIDLTLQPSGEAEQDRGDITLPRVILPLGVKIGDVRLGPLTINDAEIWDGFELQAEGAGSDWHLKHLRYQLGEISATASGRFETRRDWPLDLAVSGSLPPPYGDHWRIDLDLSGSVRNLRVQGRSEGYLNATASGSIEPLDARLPARLTVRSEQFLALDTLPETLTLQDWLVELDGNLAAGFRTRTRALLPGTEGAVETNVRGLLTTSGVTDLVLTMTALTMKGPGGDDADTADREAGELAIRGEASWQDEVAASADVSLASFPWYSLIPDFGPPPVTLQRLAGQFQYRAGTYQAELDANVSGPLGEADLATALEGDLTSVTLTNLRVNTGAGSLSGKATLDFARQLAWDVGLQLNEFNPGYWVPMLEARLSGDVSTKGRLDDSGNPVMQAQWDLAGRWQQQDAGARGALSGEAGNWVLSGLGLRVGNNRLNGNGQWGKQLQASLALQMPNPEVILPGLSGNLSATVNAGGTPDQPTGNATATGKGLSWQDTLVVEAVKLQATLRKGFAVDAKLDGQGIRSGAQQLETLALALTGTRQDHRLNVRALHEEAVVTLGFAGGLDESWQAWSGALDSGEIDLPGQSLTWVLAQSARLDYASDGTLTLGSHCWRWRESSVCAEDQTLMPALDLAYRIDRFPTSALAPVLPETVRWDSWINGEFSLTMTDAGPDGALSLDAGSGELDVLARDVWRTLRYDTLQTRVQLKPDVADLSLLLSGPELGGLVVTMEVDPRSEDRTVEGSFRLQGFDLAVAGAFVDLEEVVGELDGQGRLSGPLLKPAVHGELALSNGRVTDSRLPMPFNDMVLSLAFRGYSADLNGRWRSNDRSEGRLDGTLEWQDEPAVELTLTGDRLPFHFEPYARVELAPDITLAFRNGELEVRGRVDVPRGEIEIRELPEQAVSVSEDEVIVGVEAEEPTVRAIKMDVTVVVGDDRVSFNGFGVTGDLEGTLRIGNDMDTRGSLQLVKGQYEAYGQELELRRARLVFVGPLTEPYLDIEAVRRVDTVVAGIRLSGPVSSPETEVFSEPAMSQSEALAYVILGRPLQSRGDQGQMSRAALSLGLTQASKVTQGIGEELGIQNLILEAEGSGEEAAVVASGYITDELSLRYGVGIFEPITTVALRYDLGRYFYLEAASGLAASLDIFYTRDF